LTIRYEGDIAGQQVAAVRSAVLSGLLETLTEEHVNMINAGFIAEKRGLVINEFKNAACENFTNMLTLEVHSTTGNTLVAGTWLHGKTYLTRVNNYWLELEPLPGHLLFTEHTDRPGMIGAVGTIIGNSGVNVSQMQVCLGIQRGGDAMMVLCLDEPLSPESFREILAIPGMSKATLVQMGK
jgi:D-3-phosphoglycerate dehydrogenase